MSPAWGITTVSPRSGLRSEASARDCQGNRREIVDTWKSETGYDYSATMNFGTSNRRLSRIPRVPRYSDVCSAIDSKGYLRFNNEFAPNRQSNRIFHVNLITPSLTFHASASTFFWVCHQLPRPIDLCGLVGSPLPLCWSSEDMLDELRQARCPVQMERPYLMCRGGPSINQSQRANAGGGFSSPGILRP